MTIYKCSCGQNVQTKVAKKIGAILIDEKLYLYFNCPYCGSTSFIKGKNKKGIKKPR